MQTQFTKLSDYHWIFTAKYLPVLRKRKIELKEIVNSII